MRPSPFPIFEYRFHEVAQGRLGEAVARLRRATSPGPDGAPCLFQQFNVPQPLAAWTSLAGPGHRLAYLLHWPDIDERERCFPAFLASPAWSDEDGAPLVEATEAWLLGPNRTWNGSGAEMAAATGGIHEMRVHRIFSGQADPVADYLGQIEHPQLQVLGGTLLGVFDVLIGPEMPAIITFVGWPDFATQQHAAARLHVERRVADRRRKWKIEQGETLLRSVEHTLLRPLQP